MREDSVHEGMRVRIIHRLPDCVPPMGCGTVQSVTPVGVIVKLDNGGDTMIHFDDLEVL